MSVATTELTQDHFIHYINFNIMMSIDYTIIALKSMEIHSGKSVISQVSAIKGSLSVPIIDKQETFVPSCCIHNYVRSPIIVGWTTS